MSPLDSLALVTPLALALESSNVAFQSIERHGFTQLKKSQSRIGDPHLGMESHFLFLSYVTKISSYRVPCTSGVNTRPST